MTESADDRPPAPRPGPERRGLGLLLEGVVVVLSILLAFFLEGWRADREMARDLDQELESVRLELERNRDLVASELGTLDRVLAAGQGLLQRLESDPAPLVSVPDTLAFLGVQWHPTFSPSLGAVNTLISSGRLAQVESSELRLGLAGLDEAIGDAFEEELFSRQVSEERLIPLIGDRADLGPLVRTGVLFLEIGSGSGLTPQERIAGRAATTGGSMAFPTDLPVRNALSRRLLWLRAARAEFGELDVHLADLVDLTAAEIAR